MDGMSDIRNEIEQRLGVFARQGAKAKMANEESQLRNLMGQLGQKPDKVLYKYGAFEMHYYGREGKGDGEGRARRVLAKLHAFMRRNKLDTHGAYYQPIDDRDPSQGGMIVLLASVFDNKNLASRPGAKAKFGTNKRIIRRAGHEFLAEDEGNRTRISIKVDGAWEHATTVNTDNQTATEWIEANAKPGNPSRWLPYSFSRPGAKATAAKPDDKTECADCETEQDKAGLKLMEKADKAVSDKIRTLIKEGKPQDQAVAIALDMKRRGEL